MVRACTRSVKRVCSADHAAIQSAWQNILQACPLLLFQMFLDCRANTIPTPPNAQQLQGPKWTSCATQAPFSWGPAAAGAATTANAGCFQLPSSGCRFRSGAFRQASQSRFCFCRPEKWRPAARPARGSTASSFQLPAATARGQPLRRACQSRFSACDLKKWRPAARCGLAADCAAGPHAAAAAAPGTPASSSARWCTPPRST